MPSDFFYNFKILDLIDDRFIESKNTPHMHPGAPNALRFQGYVNCWSLCLNPLYVVYVLTGLLGVNN